MCNHEKATPTERFRGHQAYIGVWCSGGREVTIDASAAVEAVRGRGDYGPEVIVTLVLDAALGVSE